MFNTILEGWAGFFYLFNKIFLFFSERGNIKKKKSKWRISAWAVYLVGLPAWVIIFSHERNWIAAALEMGGAPAMLLGLTLAVQSLKKEEKKEKGKEKKKKKKKKKYLLSFVEEYSSGQIVETMGRVEIRVKDKQCAIEELHWVTNTTDEFLKFKEKWDFKYVDQKTLDEIRKILNDKFYTK